MVQRHLDSLVAIPYSSGKVFLQREDLQKETSHQEVAIPYSSGKVFLRGRRERGCRTILSRFRSNPLFIGKGISTFLAGLGERRCGR